MLEIILKLLYNAVVRRCDGMVDVLDSKSSVLWTWGFESPHRHHVPYRIMDTWFYRDFCFFEWPSIYVRVIIRLDKLEFDEVIL